MSKVAFPAIALALLGSSAMANAADLTTNTTVTATVVEPAALTLTYTEGEALIINKEGDLDSNALVGVFELSGYKVGTSTESVNFTDAAGEEGFLTLTSADSKSSFTVKLQTLDYDYEPKVNGGGAYETYKNMDESSERFNALIGVAEGVTAGTYSDNVTVTVSNQ